MTGAALDEIYVHARALTEIEVAHLAGNTSLPQAAHHYRTHYNHAFRAANTVLDSLRRSTRRIPNVMIMEEMSTPRTTYVLDRGAYDAPLDSVGPATPTAILPFPEDFPRNRLGLAQWLTHQENPLTARVAANRFWQLFFGEGLVSTPEDFGNQGALPSHPELLDYLAITFTESGYDHQGTHQRDRHVLHV